jgi:enamine deaminase RidA (YjgF/YER057c/UK114 family)
MSGFKEINSAESRLAELKIQLPELQRPQACYVDAVLDNGLQYLFGKDPLQADGSRRSGKVGEIVSEVQAQQDAYQTGLNLLAVIRRELGWLARVERIVKVFASVYAVPEFLYHPRVIGAFSQFMVDIFGERGRHARSAMGAGSLPYNMTVEIEMTVRVES